MSNPVEAPQTPVEAEPALAQQVRTRLGAPPPHPNDAVDAQRTFGARVADGVARIAGSWGFIGTFLAVLLAWIVLNGVQGQGSFDPYPFILLNLVLSTVAALQAPVIMMSQNRAALRDRAYADLDFRVNVRAEAEIASLKAEMEALRSQQMGALLAIQQEQIALLQHILRAQRGPGPP